MTPKLLKPTQAFTVASWIALLISVGSYFYGLLNADIGLGERGYYLILMLYSLFSVVSLQKNVRDRQEGLPNTPMYHVLSWIAALSAIALMAIGLYNSTFTLAERGFYGMAYLLAIFAAVTAQKNTRDAAYIDKLEAEGFGAPSRYQAAQSFKASPVPSAPTDPQPPL